MVIKRRLMFLFGFDPRTSEDRKLNGETKAGHVEPESHRDEPRNFVISFNFVAVTCGSTKPVIELNYFPFCLRLLRISTK